MIDDRYLVNTLNDEGRFKIIMLRQKPKECEGEIKCIWQGFVKPYEDFVVNNPGSRYVIEANERIAEGYEVMASALPQCDTEQAKQLWRKSTDVTEIIKICGANSPAYVVAESNEPDITLLLKQIVKDGEIPQDCAKTTSDPKNLISIEPINLRKTGKDILVTGQNCACVGARVCTQWIYQVNQDNYKLIFGPSQADGIEVLKKSANGYRNIKETYVHSASGTIEWTGIHRFDGNTYQLKK